MIPMWLIILIALVCYSLFESIIVYQFFFEKKNSSIWKKIHALFVAIGIVSIFATLALLISATMTNKQLQEQNKKILKNHKAYEQVKEPLYRELK